MWCMSGSAVCAYAGRGNGVAAGWRAICGISFNWMSSGHLTSAGIADRGTRWLKLGAQDAGRLSVDRSGQ